MAVIKRKTIHWTPDECERVAREWLKLLNRPDAKRMTDIDRLDMAQSRTLPKSRQRNLYAPGKILAKLDPFIREIRAELAEKKVEPKKVEAAPQTTAAPQVVVTDADHVTKAIKEGFAEALDLFFSKFSTRLGFEMASHLTNVTRNTVEPIVRNVVREELDKLQKARDLGTQQVVQAVQEAVHEQPAAAPVVLTATTPVPEGTKAVSIAPKDRKPCVCIIGLMRQQEQDVLREFGDVMAFTFIRGGEHLNAGDNLVTQIRGNDVALLMTKQGYWARPQVLKAGVPHAMLTGSVSGLKTWLQRWYNGQIGLAQGDHQESAHGTQH